MSNEIFKRVQLLADHASLIITLTVIIGIILLWTFVFSLALDAISINSKKVYADNRIEINQITEQIKSGKVNCEYVSEIRMKYAGDAFVNALDNSWIKSKLQTYWNTHSCGVEWDWWD